MDRNYNQNQIMDSAQVHHILIIEDPSFVREIQLDAATYSIGRHSSNDIVLSCQKTSRNHATLLRRTDVKTNQCSYWVLDGDLQGNRSRNGIYVNGKKSLVHELQPGDVVHFSGEASFRYRAATEAPESKESEDWQDPEPSSPVNRDTFINKETVVSEATQKPQPNRQPVATAESTAQNSLAELSPNPIIEIDLYGNITYINSAGIINFRDIHHRKLNHPLLENLIAQYHQGHDNIISREITVNNKAYQQTAHYLPEKRVIRNYITDISKQQDIAADLEQEKSFTTAIIEQVSEGIILVESATKQIVKANTASSELLGYSPAELLQMNIYELVSESEKFTLVLRAIIAEKNSFDGECVLRHQNSNLLKAQVKIYPIELATEVQICFLIRPLNSQTSAEITSHLSSQAFKRDLFNRQLQAMIANAKRSQKLLAVMMCQLDFNPHIYAAISEENRDRLATALEKRLSGSLRAGDSLVEWQEDKFAILLPQVSDIEEVTKINQRLNNSLDQSFALGETQTSISSTIGIAIYPQNGADAEILLASATTALERAKNHNIGYQFYDDAMNSQALVALELESLLQQAIKQEEFELYYQPQINVENGKVEAIEALLRWEHPELGLVAPGNFMRVAEKTKLIIPIGEWTIRTACLQNKQWQAQEFPSATITVSISLVQFQQPDLPQKIAEILAETDFAPHLLELEISATTLMDNIDHSRNLINQLKTLGVKIALDGFTTGFLALEYLKQIPFDSLKIDRALVQQLTDSPQDLAIVTALIELGKGFNLRIVAEGVETQEQVELLRSLNCNHMLGYWFGRPLAAAEASKLLQLDESEEASAIDQVSENAEDSAIESFEQHFEHFTDNTTEDTVLEVDAADSADNLDSLNSSDPPAETKSPN